MPYQVNKKTFVEKIAELVNEKKMKGISDLRDESDKSGMRVVIELKRGEIAEVVLNISTNKLSYKILRYEYGGLLDGQPRLLNLKQC